MKAIDFVVRGNAGAVQRGVLSSEAQTHVIQAQSGQEISLNLRQTDFQSQQRVGEDLVITLADGRVITIDNYFNETGAANRLFVSADGFLNEVTFVEGDGGALYAQYGPTEQWGKWSPSDELIFLGRTEVVAAAADEEVSMFAAPLLGAGLLGGGGAVAAAGIVGGAAVIGGLAGGGGGSDGNITPPTPPYVNDAEGSTSIGGDSDVAPSVVVTGGGNPGDDVSVIVGDQTQITVIGEDGTFEVVFTEETFPEDGTHEAVVIFMTGEGDVTLGGPEFIIDTTPPEVAVTEGTVSTDDFFNGETFEDGVTVKGTGEAGATVDVTVDGLTRSTVVTEAGTWSVTWEAGTLTGGEYTSEMRVVSTDSFGNSTTITDTLVVDTVAPAIAITSGSASAGDFFNASSFQSGVTLEGTGEPGAGVTVVIEGVTRTATVSAAGTWSATWQAGTLEGGEYTAGISVTSTDAYGNTSTLTDALVVDTIPPEISVTEGTQSTGDLFNSVSFANGVTLDGLGEAGTTMEITIAGQTRSVTVSDSGTWSATWASGVLVEGEYETGVSITAVDAFGNTTTLSDTLVVDTVSDVTIDTDTVETDGIVNAVERGDGVTLTGTTQAGSTVEVTFGTGTHAASVDAAGNWTATFAASEIPTGEVMAPVTATATDGSGNVTTATGMVDVDTLVRDFAITSTNGGTDGIVNASEAAQGLVMSGMTEPGSTVSVQLGNVTHNATVTATGSWTVSFAANEIAQGTYTTTMTATATDHAGNIETLTQDVTVDTDAGILTISATPVEGDDIVNAAEARDGVTLTGTADPGAIVSVSLGGVTHSVLTNTAGNWSATYAPGEVPQGVYTANITATTTDSAGNTLTETDSVQVDTRVDNLSLDAVEGDNIVSGAERLAGGGVLVTGTTEVGSSVLITLAGVTVPGVVDAAGNWTANFTSAQVPQGTEVTSVSVAATDLAGNTGALSHTVTIDTVVDPLNIAPAGGAGGIANAAEAKAGIDLGGEVEPGSSVMVTFDGTSHAATVDAAGNWSVTIPPGAITPGTYDAAISVTATDRVGNVETITDALAIDTDAPDGPVIASYTRAADGIRGISTEIDDDALAVHQINGNGSITEVEATSGDNEFLGETSFRFASNVPDGSHLIVTATDGAGNSSGTYLVLDDESINSQVHLTSPELGAFNIETVDLQFAEEAHLSLDAATLTGLSSNTNTLTVEGGADDRVTIVDATRTGTTARGGQDYDIYTLGDEGTLIIDDDITVVI
jgi:hypothetical protein